MIAIEPGRYDCLFPVFRLCQFSFGPFFLCGGNTPEANSEWVDKRLDSVYNVALVPLAGTGENHGAGGSRIAGRHSQLEFAATINFERNMASDDPVTLWIDQLRVADDSAAGKLWMHFVSRLYEAARKKLRPQTRSLYDEEDAAQSAFHSVCAGIAAGRFPDLQDRESLLRLMLVITSRKVRTASVRSAATA